LVCITFFPYHASNRVALAHERAIHYHGQDIARIERKQSIFSKTRKPHTWLVWLLSPPLFYAPGAHLDALEDLWIDEAISQVPWSDFIKRMEDEWQGFIVLVSSILRKRIGVS
jgi:hypothetical protein